MQISATTVASPPFSKASIAQPPGPALFGEEQSSINTKSRHDSSQENEFNPKSGAIKIID
jgi:hypothetical protein